MKRNHCKKHNRGFNHQCWECFADKAVEEKIQKRDEWQALKPAANHLNGANQMVQTHPMVCKRHTRRHEPSCRYCNAEIEAEKAAQKKTTIKENCRGCAWLRDNGPGAPAFCGAVNCVRQHGWVAEDQRAMKSIAAGR